MFWGAGLKRSYDLFYIESPASVFVAPVRRSVKQEQQADMQAPAKNDAHGNDDTAPVKDDGTSRSLLKKKRRRRSRRKVLSALPPRPKSKVNEAGASGNLASNDAVKENLTPTPRPPRPTSAVRPPLASNEAQRLQTSQAPFQSGKSMSQNSSDTLEKLTETFQKGRQRLSELRTPHAARSREAQGSQTPARTVRFARHPSSQDSIEIVEVPARKAFQALERLRTPSQNSSSPGTSRKDGDKAAQSMRRIASKGDESAPPPEEATPLPQPEFMSQESQASIFGNQAYTDGAIKRMTVAARKAKGDLQPLRTPHHRRQGRTAVKEEASWMLKVRYNGRGRVVTVREGMDINRIYAEVRKEFDVKQFVLKYKDEHGKRQQLKDSDGVAAFVMCAQKQKSRTVQAEICLLE